MRNKKIESLEERDRKNRDNLSKQDAWARSIEKTDFMDHVTVEEHSYGEGKRERLDYIYTKACKELKRPLFFYIHGGGLQETRSQGGITVVNLRIVDILL